ncbi:MAG TPA: dihydropteroate synthase [Coriobacteriia bacterium]|jgi:dihydropteroate synthase
MGRVWQCGRFELALDRPLVMGILNVTPDSFSDGGRFVTYADAIAEGLAVIPAGADILDVGGESTRPGSAEVPPAEEVGRVLPVVEALVADARVPVSVDTRHADVAQRCVEAGVDVLNDVGGFRDPWMREVAAGSNAGCVVMHMRGDPGTMQRSPRYGDVFAEVREWLVGQARALEDAGVGRERICLDPGIGFGKALEHNLTLLRRLPELAALGYPLLLGVSRKRFIGEVTEVPEPAERLAGSLAAAVWCAEHGADVVRVHDVGQTAQALRVLRAIEG